MSHNLHLSHNGTWVFLYQTPTEVTREVMRYHEGMKCDLYLEWVENNVLTGVHQAMERIRWVSLKMVFEWVDEHPDASKADFAAEMEYTVSKYGKDFIRLYLESQPDGRRELP